MTKTQRLEEEQRTINALLREFPVYVRPEPNSKLGMKFRSAWEAMMDREAVVSKQLMRRIAAEGNLHTLTGARWVAARGKKVLTGTVEQCTESKILLRSSDEQPTFFGMNISNFYSAMRDKKIFISWLPQESCKMLHIDYRNPSSVVLLLFGEHLDGAHSGVIVPANSDAKQSRERFTESQPTKKAKI